MNGVLEMPKCKHNMPVGSAWMGTSQAVITCSFCEAEKRSERIATLETDLAVARASARLGWSTARDLAVMFSAPSSERAARKALAELGEEPGTASSQPPKDSNESP